MKKVLFLHGWGGSDRPHWQAWLASEVAADYGTVAFPLLDNPHFPNKNRWLKQLRGLLETFAPDVVLCHSLGCTLWLHLCEEGEIKPVGHLLLVAPPRVDLKLDSIRTFFPAPMPASLYAQHTTMVSSTDDPYISQEEAQALSKALDIPLHILPEAGHINSDSGFGPWPWAKAWVESALGKKR